MKTKKRRSSVTSRFTRGVKVSSKRRSSAGRHGGRKSRMNPEVEINVPSRSLEDSLN